MSNARFIDLARQLEPLEKQIRDIKLEMVGLSATESFSIVTQAFPNARQMAINCIVEIRPSDFAKKAQEAVALLQQAGQQPTVIIHDLVGCRVILATEIIAPVQEKKPKRKKPKC